MPQRIDQDGLDRRWLGIPPRSDDSVAVPHVRSLLGAIDRMHLGTPTIAVERWSAAVNPWWLDTPGRRWMLWSMLHLANIIATHGIITPGAQKEQGVG
jgi:hypothetical protein